MGADPQGGELASSGGTCFCGSSVNPTDRGGGELRSSQGRHYPATPMTVLNPSPHNPGA